MVWPQGRLSKGGKTGYIEWKSHKQREGLISNSFIKVRQWCKEKPPHALRQKGIEGEALTQSIIEVSKSLNNCAHMPFYVS